MKKMNKKGFTIVELVIVIAVIAILAAVLIPTFSGVVDKANASAAQQTAKSSLTNALTMSSTAQLKKDTKIVVDGYAFNYTGNQLESCDYPTTSAAWTLDNNDATTATNEFNAIIISADSLENASGKLVSATDYTAAEVTMAFKNDVTKILVKAADNTLGCLASGDSVPAVKCVEVNTAAGAKSYHYYIGAATSGVETEPTTGNYYSDYDSTESKTLYFTYSVEVFVNSDLDKDVVVFTNFGK